KKHIKKGDIYEVNFCQEFYGKGELNPVKVYQRLNKISPTPFSCYGKFHSKYLISASPERFIKKEANKIISQPIKGTIKRGKNKQEDKELIKKLKNDKKERAENIMIVDLVRNDLSRTAKKGSVKVDELCGIYSFEQVHQMISTISCEIKSDENYVNIIKNAFPMGSMTGAPKIRAMKLIEKYEKTKRGLYSGAVGYISPERNFDFNVIIRSMLYNSESKYLSFIVGGAITSLSVPEKEYEECILKAEAMIKTLNNSTKA
ncbi:MAG: anthranilate synthase component I family protein, partial [Bacteroidota bacterium]|nr:anthranilate synthase component I family protein [Bacteroidota bacterium]